MVAAAAVAAPAPSESEDVDVSSRHGGDNVEDELDFGGSCSDTTTESMESDSAMPSVAQRENTRETMELAVARDDVNASRIIESAPSQEEEEQIHSEGLPVAFPPGILNAGVMHLAPHTTGTQCGRLT